MTTEQCPGINLQTIEFDAKRPDYRNAHGLGPVPPNIPTRRTEQVFVLNLPKMTPATAFADHRHSHQPIEHWTLDDLFWVLFERTDAEHELPKGVKGEFLRAIAGIPLNSKALAFAGKYSSSARAVSTLTGFDSWHEDPDVPGLRTPTILHVCTDLVLDRATHTEFGPLKRNYKQTTLLRLRNPDWTLVKYITNLRTASLDPLSKAIAKNGEEVTAGLKGMAYVQKACMALTFAEHFSLADRSHVWPDVAKVLGFPDQPEHFDKQQILYYMTRRRLNYHPLLTVPPTGIPPKKLRAVSHFRDATLAELVKELGLAATWALSGKSIDGKTSASALERDKRAKWLLETLREDQVFLDAVARWHELTFFERAIVSKFVEDCLVALSASPLALSMLRDSEFCAIARRVAKLTKRLPALSAISNRQRQVVNALNLFDPDDSLKEKPNALTEAIAKAFEQFETGKDKIATPLVSLWAHATPSILARFDRLDPNTPNPAGTAYLLRSAFGMGRLDEDQMEVLWNDLDAVLESALTKGIDSPETRALQRKLFDEDLDGGRISIRDAWWSNGAAFHAIKTSLGIIALRQMVVSAVEDKSISAREYMDITKGVLESIDNIRNFGPELSRLFDTTKNSFTHGACFVTTLESSAGSGSSYNPLQLLGLVTSTLGAVSTWYGYRDKMDSKAAFETEKEFAKADLAVAILSVAISAAELAIGGGLPIAGLSLLVLRWVLFNQSVWDYIADSTSLPPIGRLIRGVYKNMVEDDKKLVAFVESAFNRPRIGRLLATIDAYTSEASHNSVVGEQVLYFSLQASEAKYVRKYCVSAYELHENEARLLVEQADHHAI